MVNTAKKTVGTWADFRKDFISVNPEITSIIDRIDPGKNYRLYKISYPYGSQIVKSGKFYLPDNSGELVSIEDPSISEQTKKDLSYNARSIPIGMMLKNTIEVYINHQERSIPLIGQRNYTGKLFGLSTTFNKRNMFNIPMALWNVTAGGRSIFMLPKISNLIGHNKIQKNYSIQTDAPRSLSDHWHLFRDLYNCSDLNMDWEVEIIFFSDDWFRQVNDKNWMLFFNYYYRNLISLTDYFRKSQTWEAMLSLLRVDKNMLHNPYVSQKAKYILGVATGELPAFAPATDNSFGPISDIQKIYTDLYDLKDNAPIILQPTFFDCSENLPVYYSLNHPITLFPSGKQSEYSVISTLNDTAHLLKRYLKHISEQQCELHLAQFDRLINHIELDFYHSANNSYSYIKNVKDITKSDNRWHMGDKNIASHAPFLQGCIQISPKNIEPSFTGKLLKNSSEISSSAKSKSKDTDLYKVAEPVV